MTLTIQPGEVVALVGPSGSGKSTLFKLLLGFVTPELGKIKVDDIELQQLDLLELRRQLGVVLQANFLLSGTVYESIAAQSGASLDQAWAAAEIALLAQEIRALPMGMDTIIGEGGRNLSAGQRQRLLIARALINQPKILLLDEATSALDNLTQTAIQHNLAQLNITQVIAAHRLSTIKDADTIYVLRQGQIVQRGNYAELIQQPGLFAELAARQFSSS